MLMCSLQPEATPANELKQKPTDPIPRMRRVQPYYSLYKKKNPQCDTESETKSQKTFFCFPKRVFKFSQKKNTGTRQSSSLVGRESPGASLHHGITIFISLISFMVICFAHFNQLQYMLTVLAPHFHLPVFEPFLGSAFFPSWTSSN